MSDNERAREQIADVLIPYHQSLLRVAYLVFGDDSVLLRFLPIRESGESLDQPHPAAPNLDIESPSPVAERPTGDLLQFSRNHRRPRM